MVSLSILPVFVLVFLFSFAVTSAILPKWIERITRRGLVGKDMNKYDKREVAEMGGVAVLFGFCAAMIVAIFMATYTEAIDLNLTVIFASLSTIIIIGLIGIIDDVIGWKDGIRKWQHALMPVFAALPLMAVEVGTTTMNMPIVGEVNFGIFYSLLLVPIGITGASNAFNMLAGMNGLEAGQGIIIIGSLSLLAAYTQQYEAAIIGIGMIAALLAFIRFNWFPARVFGGDSLTLMTGASVAVISITGNMEKIGMLLISLYFIELMLKAKHRFQSESFGLPQKDGTLKPLSKDGSITQLIMSRGRFNEKQVVMIIFAIQIIISAFVVSFSVLRLFYLLD